MASDSYNDDDFDSSITSELSQSSKETSMISIEDKTCSKDSFTDKSGLTATINPPKLQSDPTELVTSASVRQAAFEEWKRSKDKKMKGSRKESKNTGSTKSSATRAENENYKEKCDKAVEEWLSRKKEEEKKRLKEQREKKEKEEREKREKDDRILNTSRTVMDAWTDSKTKKLQEKQRKKRQEEKELEEKMAKEKIEKEDSSNEAFRVWREQKDKQLKEIQHKKRIQLEQERKVAEVEAAERRSVSEKAIEAWKTNKNETLCSSSKTSLSSEGSRPAWRPARSLRYDYPTSEKVEKASHKTQPQRKAAGTLSLTKSLESNKVQTKKTVQVCCQTLEYWCSCDD